MLRQTRGFIALTLLAAFLGSSIQVPVFAQDFSVNQLPLPGSMVFVSPRFNPALIKGLTVHRDNPFLFDFIVDPGQSHMSRQELKDASDRMIKYFFAALTLPDKDVWVNLSPYERNRMVPVSLGQTAMGRDLLAQDYLLKQLTASLINPQKALGRSFWNTVYAKAKAMYGTTEVPVNTFNKVWIVPQRVGIYEHGQTAFIVDGHLKVMLEEDYLSLTKHNAIDLQSQAGNILNVKAPQGNSRSTNELGSQIIKQIILPEIEKEINDGRNFATLRQIFYAQALAVWFKHNLKQALLNRVYADKSTVKGIDQNDSATNQAIYRQYLKAYKKGVFNFIQEDVDPVTQETLPRKYFSGGYTEGDLSRAMVSVESLPRGNGESAPLMIVRDLVETSGKDAAVLARNVEDAAMNKKVSPDGNYMAELGQPDSQGWRIITIEKGNHFVYSRQGLIVDFQFSKNSRMLIIREKLGPSFVLHSLELEDIQNAFLQEQGQVFGESIQGVWRVVVKEGPQGFKTVLILKNSKGWEVLYSRDIKSMQPLNSLAWQIASTLNKIFPSVQRATKKSFNAIVNQYSDFAMTVKNFSPDRKYTAKLDEKNKVESRTIKAAKDKAMKRTDVGGIDLSGQDAALRVTKDAQGGVRVDVDPALIARVLREGLSEVDPVIIDMRPAVLGDLFANVR